MSITTVQGAFESYEKNVVRIPAAQNDRAKEVHPLVRAAVEKALGPLYIRSVLAGSYARKVQTAPRLKDVDIIIVLADPDGVFAGSADAALDALWAAASTCDVATPVEKGVRAVKLEIDGEEFTVDLVAALEDSSGELLLARRRPELGQDDWTKGRPKGQMDAHWAKNKDADGSYIPSVRLVKTWNQRNPFRDKKTALPSYLVESMLYHAMTEPMEFADSMVAFFRAAHTHLSDATPTVPCPGDIDNYVDEVLDEDRRISALNTVAVALTSAEEAVSHGDVEGALDCWARIFGPAFPAPNGDVSQLAAALRNRTARIAGSSVSASGAGDRQAINVRPWRSE